MKTFTLFILVIFAVSSCKIIKPQLPDLPPSQLPPTPLPDSKIDVPVTFDLTPVFADFNAQVPANFSGNGSAGPGSYQWNVQRTPFNLSVTNNVLAIQDQANCYGEGDIRVLGHTIKVCSCNVTANIGINTTFNLASNYSLSGNAVMSQFAVSPCLLTFANLNVTPILTGAATTAINNGLNTVNQKISHYSVLAPMQSAWNTLSQPISIPGIGFLLLNPSAVRMDTPTGSGSTLHFPIGITAKPQLFSTNPGQPLATTIPNISSAAGNGFNITVDANLDYDTLNKVIATNLAGKRITYPKGYIDIKNVELYGVGNNHILLNVTFKGKYGWVCYKGNLYFTGVPVYDTTTGNLYLTQVDFDTRTTQALSDKGASWILNAVIKSFFNDQVHVNISSQINSVKNSLSQAINRQVTPTVTLSGTVNSLNLQGILPQSKLLLIRLTTAGTLTAIVK